MMNSAPICRDLPCVSVVIVTYNRFQTLKPTLESFLGNTDYPREKMEVIISDDGSDDCTKRKMYDLRYDKLISGGGNRGLSANFNRGLVASTSDFILQIQDDWLCEGPRYYLQAAIAALEQYSDVGMIVLNSDPNNLQIRKYYQLVMDSGEEIRIRVYPNNPGKKIKNVAEHAYTDWPHVKRRSFVEKVGLYNEKLPMWAAEREYAQRVNSQERYFIADMNGANVFRHIGSGCSFNVGSMRSRLMARVRKIPFASNIIDKLKKRLNKDSASQ